MIARRSLFGWIAAAFAAPLAKPRPDSAGLKEWGWVKLRPEDSIPIPCDLARRCDLSRLGLIDRESALEFLPRTVVLKG